MVHAAAPGHPAHDAGAGPRASQQERRQQQQQPLLIRRTLLLAVIALTGCTASIRRPVKTTDAATALTQVTRSSANEFNPAVSPDGTELAYEVASSAEAVPHVEVMALARAGATPARTLYSSEARLGVEPTWLPDGSGVLFVSKTKRSPRGLVQTFGAAPGATSFLVDAADLSFPAEWPAVAPDGKTLAFALTEVDVFQSGWPSTRHYDHALGLSDLIGTGTTLLGAGTDPAWSPDGKRIAFARLEDGHGHLFVANADGTGAQRITDGSADDMEPAWSPDGSCIVFSSAHGTDQITQSNLFALRPDGSGLVQLTEGDHVAGRPTWARDGSIYFHADAMERFHIWRVRVKGTLCGSGST
jgi:TolB protein